ncbi:MAG: ankyrin repeat domain-containing protein [Vicinamibacteria bacterium]
MNADQNTVSRRCPPFPEALARVHPDNLDPDGREVAIVRLMLGHGADPKSCWFAGPTSSAGGPQSLTMCVMDYAVRSRSETLLSLVRERGAPVNTKSSSSLATAAERGDLQGVGLLAEGGTPVGTALGGAVKNFRFDVVDYLDTRPGALEFKAPRTTSLADSALARAVDGKVQDGLTASEQAFMTAARRGNTEAVMAELGRGVRINRLDDYSLSAHMRAAAWGHTETVRALLKAGADPDLMDTKDGAAPGSRVVRVGRARRTIDGHGRTTRR